MSEDAAPEDGHGASVPGEWAAQLLGYWFDPATKPLWFRGGPAFDAEVEARFGDWHGALRDQVPDYFLTDPAHALAAVILFDQVPRNIHRGHADAFATDALALAISRAAVAQALDAGLTVDQRLFLYLPFEHSEAMDDQRESVRLISALGDASYTEFAQAHFDTVARFGRFPHRNAALGRANRDDEAAALAAGAGF